jgi:hypothetical protein
MEVRICSLSRGVDKTVVVLVGGLVKGWKDDRDRNLFRDCIFKVASLLLKVGPLNWEERDRKRREGT